MENMIVTPRVLLEVLRANWYMKKSGWTPDERRAFWDEMKIQAHANNQSIPSTQQLHELVK